VRKKARQLLSVVVMRVPIISGDPARATIVRNAYNLNKG
jgi:hypothetical protein